MNHSLSGCLKKKSFKYGERIDPLGRLHNVLMSMRLYGGNNKQEGYTVRPHGT